MKAGAPRVERERHPNVIFLRASVTSFPGRRNSYKLTRECEKGKDNLKDPAALPAPGTNPPRFHAPLTPWSTPLPQAGMKTSREPEKHSDASAEGGESALQSPASVSSSCQATSMCSCSCRVIAMEDETEGQKERSATSSECQVGRWAPGQSRLI